MLPHARVVLHQPSGGGQGTLPDLALQAKEIVRVRAQMEEILARHTGQDVETLRADTDRDLVLTAEEAVAYGLVGRRPGQPEAAGLGAVVLSRPGREALRGALHAAEHGTRRGEHGGHGRHGEPQAQLPSDRMGLVHEGGGGDPGDAAITASTQARPHRPRAVIPSSSTDMSAM